MIWSSWSLEVKNMKVAVGFVLLCLMALPVMAVNPNGPAAYNGLNKGASDVMHLELYEKDTNWDPVVGGAFGRLTFDTESFVFNGHGLEANTDYTLIRYTDPWPGSPVCLASGTSNDGGNINLAGEMQNGGPKVWLVLSSDVNCGVAMIGWHPSEYLFEYNTI